jgi:hypothetical protein
MSLPKFVNIFKFWLYKTITDLGKFVGFSQYTDNSIYIYIYIMYVTRTTSFGLSYFRPSSGPSITLLLAKPGVIWLFF